MLLKLMLYANLLLSQAFVAVDGSKHRPASTFECYVCKSQYFMDVRFTICII
jgi:hypothetical protein